ncbi:MAG: hypothetical protein Q8O32_00050 [bacterium]|nr:hypothetical protein [bacterium]
MANDQQNLNQQELEGLAKAKGQRLAFLLSAANIDDEQKEAWLTLLPEMSLEQLEKLVDVLEAQYMNQQSKNIDEDFKKDLTNIKNEYDQKEADLEKDTIEKMRKLTENL